MIVAATTRPCSSQSQAARWNPGGIGLCWGCTTRVTQEQWAEWIVLAVLIFGMQLARPILAQTAGINRTVEEKREGKEGKDSVS